MTGGRLRGLAAVLAVVLAAVLALSGCGAGLAGAESPSGDRLRVVTTMSVLADLVERAGGDAVEVRSLTPVGGDPHTHEPAPSDARAIAEADLVVDNGLGLSPWFEPLAEGAREPVLRLGERVGAALLADSGEPDPHLWMVPPTAAAYVDAVAAELARLDPAGAEGYRARADAARAELTALDAELRAAIETVPPGDRLLVTSHDAYGYFADHYGIEVVGSVVGASTESEPSARSVAALVDLVREREIPTLFLETTVNPALLERVAADAGARLGDPLYGDSVGPPGSGAEDYEGMLRATTEALVAGWTR